MTLAETVRKRVQERAPFHDHMEQIIVSQPGLTIRCELTGADKLGCALMQVELVEENGPALAPPELLARANRVCDKVTYLLEPLQTIELDTKSCQVLVRSKQPKVQQGGFLSYYELMADGSRHTYLRRYCYSVSGKSRGAIAFLLTGDQLEMLLDDLIATTSRIRN